MDVDDSEVGDSPHCSAAGARLDGQWASEMRTKTTRLCRIAADTYVGPDISHAAFETVPATDTVGYLRDLLAVLYVIPRVASIMLGMTIRERMLGAWTLRD